MSNLQPEDATGQNKDQVPMRSYLDQTVVPLLLEAMAVLTKERPDRPIEFLADYLEKNNNERQLQQVNEEKF